MRITVAKIGSSETVSYAVNELIRLIKEMDSTVTLDVRKYASYDEKVKNALWVGMGFTEESEKDTVYIDVKDSVGVISGSNEQSVLIAAYRFMYEMGCRYLYPGKEGEVIPKKKLGNTDFTVCVKETAAYSHRGMCIEGTVGYEHIFNMIDWLPKVGMNEYFFQFLTPATFFNQYYERFPDGHLSDDEVDAMVRSLDEEIAKRSLKYQAVGHGWNCAPFGLPASGWYEYEGEPPKEIKEILAQLDGERKFRGNKPLNTNLCYSNPVVREKIVNYVVEYCKNNQYKDYIAFFMADGGNNHCECENCQKKTPSDYLIMMMNDLDEKLTEQGIKTKILLPFYNDLMWAPETERLHNPNRFAMDFAPISRSYSVSYADYDFTEEIEIEPYVRNKNVFKGSLPKTVAMFKKWINEQGIKDVMLFDYHLMWDHHYDPGYYACAKILQKDMASLDKIGVDGMVSCQLQRIAFPNNLPMYCMAKTLWDKNETFCDIVSEYFTTAYGEYAKEVEEYLSTLSKLFVPEVLRGEKPYDAQEMIQQYNKAKAFIDEFKEKYIDKLASTSKVWEYLSYHAELVKFNADIYIDRFNKNEEGVKEKIKEFGKMIEDLREATDTVLDDNFLKGDIYNNLIGWRKTI